MLVVTVITALHDWNAQRYVHNLMNKTEKFLVIRDGKLQAVPLTELVVGDVVQITSGDTLPVDGIFIQVGEYSGQLLSCTSLSVVRQDEN